MFNLKMMTSERSTSVNGHRELTKEDRLYLEWAVIQKQLLGHQDPEVKFAISSDHNGKLEKRMREIEDLLGITPNQRNKLGEVISGIEKKTGVSRVQTGMYLGSSTELHE